MYNTDSYQENLQLWKKAYTEVLTVCEKYPNFNKDCYKCQREGYGRYIGCPDDGNQPEYGWYLMLGFSIGAYIFYEDFNKILDKYIQKNKSQLK